MKDESLDGLGELVSESTRAVMELGTRFQEKFKELKDANKKLRVELATLKGAIVSIYTDGSVAPIHVMQAIKSMQDYIKHGGAAGVDCTECPSVGLHAHKRFGDVTSSCVVYVAYKKGFHKERTDKELFEVRRKLFDDICAFLNGHLQGSAAERLKKERENFIGIPAKLDAQRTSDACSPPEQCGGLYVCTKHRTKEPLMPGPAVPDDVNSRLAAIAHIDTQTGQRANEASPCQYPGCHGSGTAHILECPDNPRTDSASIDYGAFRKSAWDALVDRNIALEKENAELRQRTEPARTDSPRCSVCGASRIVGDDGRVGACSLVPGSDGKGGCPDPLRDYNAEQRRDAIPALTDVRIGQLAGRTIDPGGTVSLDEARAMAVEIQSRRAKPANKETNEQWFRAEFLYWITGPNGLGWSPATPSIQKHLDSLLDIVKRGSNRLVGSLELDYRSSREVMKARPEESLREAIKRYRDEMMKHREELCFIVHYLGHQDQDANHAWMVRRIRAVLLGEDPSKVEPWNEMDSVRPPGIDWKHRHAEAVKERTEYHRRWVQASNELEAMKRAQSLHWKLILDCRATYGHITKMAETAVRVGYDYFVWNGRVYYITSAQNVTFEDKGVVEDVLARMETKGRD